MRDNESPSKSPPEAGSARPKFSIVVPAHHRLERLVDCLEGLARLNYDPEQYEVVVVDDGSDPPIADQPKIQQCGLPLQCRFLFQENRGPAAARNLGIREARGDWIALIDSDCVPDPNWLAELDHATAANPDAIVGGYCDNGLPGNVYSTASHILLKYVYQAFNPDPKAATFFVTMNMAFRKDLFNQLGGFDAGFSLSAGEDRDLCDRWRRRIGPMIYHPAAVIHHSHWLHAGGFWRQHYQYGLGAAVYRARKKRRENTGRPSRAHTDPAPDPIVFYARLVCYPLRGRVFHPKAWGFAFLLIISQVAYVAGCARGVIRRQGSSESVYER